MDGCFKERGFLSMAKEELTSLTSALSDNIIAGDLDVPEGKSQNSNYFTMSGTKIKIFRLVDVQNLKT